MSTTMALSGRTVLSGAAAGLIGATIAGLGVFALCKLFVVHPPLNLRISLAFAMIPAFAGSCAAFILYARFAFDAGWFFGALAGVTSGVFADIGYLLSYDRLTPDAASLVLHGFAGTVAGGAIGAVLGAIVGPVLAGPRRMR